MADDFNHWLEEALSWSAASPCWQETHVETFVKALRELATRRRFECATRRDTFDALLNRIAREGAAGLEWVGWKMRSPSEVAAAVPLDQVSVITEQLEELLASLKQIERERKRQPPDEAFGALRTWFADLESEVGAARSLLIRLPEVFTEATAVGAEQSDATPSEAAAVAAAESAELADPPVAAANVEEVGSAVAAEPPPIETALTITEPPPEEAEPVVVAAEVEADRAPAFIETDVLTGAVSALSNETGEDEFSVRLCESIPDAPPPERALVAAPAVPHAAPAEPQVGVPQEPHPVKERTPQWVDPLLARLHTRLPLTAKQRAPNAGSAERPVHHHEFAALFWEHVRLNDLAAAYWITRVIEAAAEESPISPDTIAAMQALQWFWDDPAALLDQCSLVADGQPPDSDAARTAVLGSALRMALFAPSIVEAQESAFKHVLQDRANHKDLDVIVAAVREFAHGFQPLERRHVIAIADQQERTVAVNAATVAVQQWLETAPKRRMRKFGVTDVFRTWTQPGGRMHNAALPVLNRNAQQAAAVARQAEWWALHAAVESALNEDNRTLNPRDPQRIVGDARDQVLSRAAEFSQILKEWCEAVGHSSTGEDGNTLPPQVAVLRDRIAAAAPSTIALLKSMENAASGAADRAAVFHLQREVAAIHSALLVEFPLACADPAVAATWYRDAAPSLRAMLLRRLQLVPELALPDDADVEERLPTIGIALAASTSRISPGEAVRQWLNDGDFRWVDRYVDGIGATAAGQELQRVAQEQRAEWERRLEAEIAAAAEEVENAAIGTWLQSVEAEALREELDNILPAEVRLFGPVLDRVQDIRSRCERSQAERVSELANRWRVLHQTLSDAAITASSMNRIDDVIRTSLEAMDVRAGEALLQEIEAIIDRSGTIEQDALDALAFRREAGTAPLDDFLERESAISEWLHDNDDIWRAFPQDRRYLPDRLRHGATLADGLLCAPPQEDRRQEAARAIDAWSQLRQIPFDRAGSLPETVDRVATILRFLGFVYEGVEEAPAAKVEHLFLDVRMSAGKHSPIPVWGSQARDRYQVLIVRNARSAARIQESIAGVRRHKEPMLLMVVNHLEPEARRELAAYTRAEEDPIITLDDVLMLHLATATSRSLRLFFDCALPFSAANPYLAQRDGPVAPEMFRGHKQAVARLMDRDGTCFVCGGRQLGKSALQNYIQKEFDLRTPTCHVWYVNIKEHFNPRERQSAATLWNLLQERFDQASLLAGINRRVDIPAQLKQVFDNQPALEVTAFLDEADDLLEAMIHDRRRVWTALTTLMDQTRRRLKIVFAGNFHISRFAALRNQSVTILGTPIEIGPMDFAAATDLIVEPLESLGYRFREPRAVLKILSLTHRHASLLQLFMYELLASKMKRRTTGGPPYWIESADVEKTHSHPRVRDEMAKRIELTLHLDPEYRAIAYAMLLDQETNHDFRVSYSTSELRQMAEVVWPEGFQSLNNSDVEARLNEMRTLGIIVRTGDRFRLAGRHIIDLFGSYARIREGVEDLAHEKRREKFDESGVHGWIASGPTRYSPLTLVQERLLQLPQTHVRLLFVSGSGGLDDISAAFATLMRPRGVAPTNEYTIPRESYGRNETVIWLRAFRKRQAPGSHAILLQRVEDSTPAAVFQHVDGIQAYSRNVEDPKKTFQLVLVLDPVAGWAWLQNDSVARRSFEEKALESIRWDDAGIRSRLDDLGKAPNLQTVESVRVATSGWHLLLHSFFSKWPNKDDDPTAARTSLAAELTDPESETARNFAAGLGLAPDLAPAAAFRDLYRSGEPISHLDALELFGGPVVEFLQRYALVTARATGNGSVLTVDPLAARVWIAADRAPA